MANIRQTDTPAQTGRGIPDEALGGPAEEATFDRELEQAEQDRDEEDEDEDED